MFIQYLITPPFMRPSGQPGLGRTQHHRSPLVALLTEPEPSECEWIVPGTVTP